MIGVFDSGFGGLTILKQFIKKLPGYDYAYLGDNARTPYGNKSQAVIYDYSCQAVDFLFSQGCELIIMACNTASAKALRKIQQEFLLKRYPKKRVLGVVIPAAEATVEVLAKMRKKNNRVGVIGTRSTVNSKVYSQEIHKLNPKLEIYSQSCPLLVPLVEEGWTRKPEAKMILKKYLRPLKQKQIQALILGCTHYPFLEKEIQRIAGKNVKIVSTPEVVAEKLVDYLQRHPEIEKKLSKNKKRLFFTTDEVDRFKQFGEKFLGRKINKIERIQL